MNALQKELRWERMWNLATLDATNELSKELYIPIDMRNIQEALRGKIHAHYKNTEYGTAPGALHADIVSLLRLKISTEELLKMLIWGDQVLVLSGSERVAESFWSSVSYDLRGKHASSWIGELFSKLQREQSQSREDLSRKLDQLEEKISDWDARILDLIDINVSTLRSFLALTAKYNIFVSAWCQVENMLTAKGLDEIFVVGRNLAVERNLSEADISFPGAWTGEIRAFILRGSR